MKLEKVLNFILSLICVSTALPTKDHRVTCDKKKYILDSDGNYLKTACIIFLETSHGEACKNVGMSLFVIDSGSTRAQIISFATDIFGVNGGTTLWVKEKSEKHGKWQIYDPKEDSSWDDTAEFVETYHGHLNEECLILAAIDRFQVETQSCNALMYPICEFQEPEKLIRSKIDPTKPNASQSFLNLFLNFKVCNDIPNFLVRFSFCDK